MLSPKALVTRPYHPGVTSAACLVVALLVAITRFGVSVRADDPGGEAVHEAASVPQAGHSLHGDAFNEGPRGAATLMAGMPKVHFAVTSTNAAVQAFIDQGVGQLHGFWYFEAERSFRQAAKLDSDCALAYWGMAMANVNNATRAREFIAQAVARRNRASVREQRWIDALADFHREKETDGEKKDRPAKDRRRNYVRALESLVQDFPDDVEAKAFLALQIWDNAGFGNGEKSYSRSPVTRRSMPCSTRCSPRPRCTRRITTRIHLWDTEKPIRALGSAALGGPAGPGIAHL